MDNPYLSQRPASAGAGGFHPTEAWLALADLVSDSGARRIVHPHPAGRMTLAELCAAASVPPRVPPRPELLCVLIKSIEIDGSGGEDYAALLADETGEMCATLHTKVFNDHPGAVVVGAALLLKQTPVLTLAPWSHCLIVHPDGVLHVIPPPMHSPPASAASPGASHAASSAYAPAAAAAAAAAAARRGAGAAAGAAAASPIGECAEVAGGGRVVRRGHTEGVERYGGGADEHDAWAATGASQGPSQGASLLGGTSQRGASPKGSSQLGRPSCMQGLTTASQSPQCPLTSTSLILAIFRCRRTVGVGSAMSSMQETLPQSMQTK
jgi:hypothetical protein